MVLAGGRVAGANYLLIAPKIAERVVAADHLDQCRADQESSPIAQAGKDAVAGLSCPRSIRRRSWRCARSRG
ncbi:MAG: hypothetical protein M9905_06110 [Rhizobiaceae bacterium]|nr:hypothetical protein [Rhizobiaceae bacterium]